MINSHSAGGAEFETHHGWTIRDLNILLALILFALVLRLIFFTGFYGSDEVTYFQMARSILDGKWDRSDYIGSIRYGVNIPMAIFLKLFGLSEFSANFWSLSTSLGEIALVYAAAKQMWGARTAWIAGLFLAVLPVHVHYAGRLMADSPLAFFVSLCFLSAWQGGKRNSIVQYLLAGIAVGAVFWIKDAVFYLTVAVLGSYILLARQLHMRWFWMACSAGAMVLLNCVLIWQLYEDPLHLFKVSFGSLRHVNNTAVSFRQSPDYYLSYLLVEIKHTFLFFYFALGAAYLVVKRHKLSQILTTFEGFCLVWIFGFIGVLTLLSTRQVNYMLIFCAPLALLAAYFVASVGRQMQIVIVLLTVVGGIVLSAFEQQAVRTFTANSRATVAFAELHPDAVVFAGTGAVRAETYQEILGNLNGQRSPMMSLTALDALLESTSDLTNRLPIASSATQAFAVMDPQTAGWGAKGDSGWATRLSSSCLVRSDDLVPAAMGYGRYVVDGLLAAIIVLPEPLATKINTKLISTLRPQAATIFQVGAPCFSSGS